MAGHVRKATIRAGQGADQIVVRGPAESRAKVGRLIALLDEPVARDARARAVTR